MTTYTKEWHYEYCMGETECKHGDPECPHNHFLKNEQCKCTPTNKPADKDLGGKMGKKYHIYAYKHYWTESALDPDSRDIPVPYMKDEREYVIKAKSEKEAIKKAEIEYGSGERVDKDNKYIENPDGSWTIMGVRKVEL